MPLGAVAVVARCCGAVAWAVARGRRRPGGASRAAWSPRAAVSSVGALWPSPRRWRASAGNPQRRYDMVSVGRGSPPSRGTRYDTETVEETVWWHSAVSRFESVSGSQYFSARSPSHSLAIVLLVSLAASFTSVRSSLRMISSSEWRFRPTHLAPSRMSQTQPILTLNLDSFQGGKVTFGKGARSAAGEGHSGGSSAAAVGTVLTGPPTAGSTSSTAAAIRRAISLSYGQS